MYEINKRATGTLSAMQPDLEYIPVCSDPRGSTFARNAQGGRGPQGDPYPDREAVNAV